MDNRNQEPATITQQTKFCAETAKVIVALTGALEADLVNDKFMVSSTKRMIEELINWGKIDG